MHPARLLGSSLLLVGMLHLGDKVAGQPLWLLVGVALAAVLANAWAIGAFSGQFPATDAEVDG